MFTSFQLTSGWSLVPSTPSKDTDETRAVYFIDAAVPGAQVLIDSLDEGAEVVLLQADSDGVRQMVDYLADRTELGSIHILSHGSEGALRLGDTTLNGSNLGEYGESLERIGASLNDDGDILLYGCNVAAGVGGRAFVEALAERTGADIAASDDLTGASRLGGDWQLEVSTGVIEATDIFTSDYQYTLDTLTFDGFTDIKAFNSPTASGTFGSWSIEVYDSFQPLPGPELIATTGINGPTARLGGIGIGNAGEYRYVEFEQTDGSLFTPTGLTLKVDNHPDVPTMAVTLTAYDASGTELGSYTSPQKSDEEQWSVTFTGADFSGFSGIDTLRISAPTNYVFLDDFSYTIVAAGPTITDSHITITSSGSGTGGAYKIGDTITVEWNNSAGGDNNAGITGVTADFSAFGGGAAVAASKSGEIWTASYTLTSGTVDGTGLNVAITASDGSETTTGDTSNLTVDNQAPTVTDGNLSISGASGTGGAYKVGDTVTAIWNDTAGGDNNGDTLSGVTFDFSAFGGGAAVSASHSSGTWTATHTITDGAVDGTGLNVSATATDNAGNTTTTADTTNATVDSESPTVTDGHIGITSSGSGADGAYIIGDTVTVTWTDTGGDANGDTIAGVTADFTQFGGGAAVVASESGGVWTASYTLAGGAIEASDRNVTVTATDDAGNTTTTVDTTNLTVDNQAPSAPSTPDLDAGSDSGDSNTDNTTNDTTPTLSGTAEAGATVTLYDTDGTTELGTASADGSGNWSITASTLSAGSHTLTAKAQDASGNLSSASSGLTIDVDTSAPAVGSVSVPSDGTYKIGDTLEFTVNFDSNISVAGTDSTLALTLGSDTVTAAYLSNTATSITYRYTVQADDLDADGIAVGALTLNTSSISDSSGNSADLSLNGVGSTAAVRVDGVPPGTPAGTLAVDENSANSTAVGTVSSTDAVSFTLIDDAGGRFSIDNGGNVTVADGSLLDRETDTTHQITVQATDSAGNPRSETLTVTVNDVNEAPTVSSAPTVGTAPATDHSFSTADFNFSDVDGDALQSIAITAIGTGTLKLAGSDISGSLPQTVTRAQLENGDLTLTPDGNGDQTFTYSVSDGSLSSSLQTMTVTINNTPVLAGLDGAPTYSEATATAVTLDADVTVSDTEMEALNGGNGDYSGAVLTLSRNGGADSDDSFGFDLSGASFTVSGGNLQSGGQTFATFTDSGGTLTITFTSSETTATSALVDEVLQRLQYRNSDEAPEASVPLDYRFDDGITAASGSVSVGITAENDAPVFSGLDNTPTFTEDGDAVVLDGDATLADAELDAAASGSGSYDGATLTLVRHGGANTEDQFSAAGTLGTLTEGEALMVGGTTVGTVTSNSGGTLLLTFSAAATSALVDSALQQIAYSNSSDTPPTSAQLDYTFTDGNSGDQGSGGAETTSGSVVVGITATNDVSVIGNLDGDKVGNYRPGNGAVLLDQNGDATVTDVDGSGYDGGSLTVSISNGGVDGEDVLAINDQGTSAGQIGASGGALSYGGTQIGSYTGGSLGTDLVVTFNGNAADAAIGALLQNISYENANTSPNKGARSFSFALEDGLGDTSQTASATLRWYVPSSGGDGNGGSTTTTDTVDGVEVTTTTDSDGTVTTTIPVVTDDRDEDPNTTTGDADIPLINGDTNNNGNVVIATLPVGVGLSASGPSRSQTTTDAMTTLVQEIDQRDSLEESSLISGARSFLANLSSTTTLDVRTIIPTTTATSLSSPIVITGSSSESGASQSEAFVIDMRNLPAGSSLQLDNIEFASIVGSAIVTGGAGNNYVVGDDAAQTIILGEGDDELHGGGGDDTVGSLGGDDRLYGEAGNDTLFGGLGADQLHGGSEFDVVTYEGNREDYLVTQVHSVVTVQSKADPSDIDMLINIESLTFADGEEDVSYDEDLMWIAGLYDQVLGRQGDIAGVQYWAQQVADGLSEADVALLFMTSPEAGQVLDVTTQGREVVVETLYQSLLGRESDVEGRAYWTNDLENGASLRDVVFGFMASDEMHTHHMSDSQWDFIA